MEDLLKQSGASMSYDKPHKRLYITYTGHTPVNQYMQLTEQMLTAVMQYEVDTCLVDLRKRSEGTEQTLKYSIDSIKKAVSYGLKAIALIKPESQKELKLIEQFVKEMGQDVASIFTTKSKAEEWLDKQSNTSTRSRAA